MFGEASDRLCSYCAEVEGTWLADKETQTQTQRLRSNARMFTEGGPLLRHPTLSAVIGNQRNDEDGQVWPWSGRR